jgi:hypothetical protein
MLEKLFKINIKSIIGNLSAAVLLKIGRRATCFYNGGNLPVNKLRLKM